MSDEHHVHFFPFVLDRLEGPRLDNVWQLSGCIFFLSIAVTIRSSGGLSEADVERMVREAEEHAASDRERKVWLFFVV